MLRMKIHPDSDGLITLSGEWVSSGVSDNFDG
jgi:hypothetical protein